MTESTSNLNLTPEEKRAYGHLFQQADPEGLGVVTGDVAVKFFEKTKLDPGVLGQIWQLADTENTGFLRPQGFSIVLRLIGHSQAGRSPTEEVARKPGPLPRFDGITLPGQPQASPAAQSTPPLVQQPSGGPARIPPLAPERVNEYSSLFEKAGAINGFLAGDGAKRVFEKARLPNEVLGQIWALADREQRGALNCAEFVVAMHLLASMRSGAIRAVPPTLPPSLYEAAAPKPPSIPQSSSIPRQTTGQGPKRTDSPLATQQVGTSPVSAQHTGNDWLITPADKARFDHAFGTMDRSGRGYVTGEQAVSFFSNSGLSEDVLASIWDLADINSEGQLTKDEFAVAMWLIRQQRARKAGRGEELPQSLPPKLVPPSMRHQVLPPSQSTAPTFDNAAAAAQQPSQSKSAADDLFGLDALSDSSAQKPSDPFANDQGSQASSPSNRGFPPQPATRSQGTTFKPFVPSSSFGQGLANQNTGGSVQSDLSSNKGPTQQAQGGDDLLGDNDPEVSKKFTAETTELANMSNQVGNLRSQMQEVQNKKTTTERDVTASSSQKRELETRLAQFRAQYEKEVREVKSFEEQLNASRQETRKLGQDIAMIEGTHQDLKNQHQQLSAALASDQQENSALKERIRAMNAEISELRPQVEKLKSDARQQKGMTAINKKQLATSESERDKLRNEKDDLERSMNETAVPRAETSSNVASPGVTSPVTSPSSGASKNPFFRQNTQQSFDRSVSNLPQPSQGASAFESMFGTSQSSERTETPPTTFRGTSASATPEPPDTSHISTPSVSSPRSALRETPLTQEPPAPPESRQITSSSLPLGSNLARSESFGSSVKANPPASRSGFSGNVNPAPSSTSSINGDQSRSKGNEPFLAAGAAAGALHAGTMAQDSSSTSDDKIDTPTSSSRAHAKQASIPGAFPGEIESPMPSTTTGSSVASGTGEKTREAPTAKPEFDSAFGSSLGENTPNQGGHPSTSPSVPENFTNSSGKHIAEFPPIQDLQEDDESDSDSVSQKGFEDDFADASNAHEQSRFGNGFDGSMGQQTSIQSTQPTLAVPQSQASDSHSSAPSSALPTPNEQMSPPTYESAMPQGQPDEQDFPREFDGLLPSREATEPIYEGLQSPPAIPGSDATLATTGPRTSSLNKTISHELKDGQSARPSHNDDFESAFDDLAEANEVDEQGHDGFDFNSSRRDDNEFNPNFDSPSTSKPTTNDFNSTTAGSFGSLPAGQTTDSSSHDWDAIFSGLDKTPTIAGGNDGKSPFDLDGPPELKGGSTSSNTLRRPQAPARAISAGTEHDDPILKTLTSMGYPREKSLKALEKYDYNLEKAADYLTSGRA
ncbi:MAG: hypothetical protein M1831_006786 [Alyxoria varia]|nr:MAG: hypothetical protein M1831_006786 [Alyxoria varia]